MTNLKGLSLLFHRSLTSWRVFNWGREGGVCQGFRRNLRCASPSLMTMCLLSSSNDRNSFNAPWLSCAETVQLPCNIPLCNCNSLFLTVSASWELARGLGAQHRLEVKEQGCSSLASASVRGQSCWAALGRIHCMCRSGLGWLMKTTVGESIWHHRQSRRGGAGWECGKSWYLRQDRSVLRV